MISSDADLVVAAVACAAQVAALTCTRAGAQPPRIPGWLHSPALAGELIASAGGAEG